MELEGKKALIVGSSKGMGKEVAISFAKEGASVVLCAENMQKLVEVKKEMNNLGYDKVYLIEWDVRDVKNADNVMKKASDFMDGLDIVVNAAGVIDHERFLTVSEEAFDFIFDINVKGIYFSSQAAANYFINSNRKGKIINFASETGFQPSHMPYGASKWSVVGFTMGMAKHLWKRGIMVCSIAPGPIATDMMNWEEGKSLDFPNCFGTMGDKKEVADLVVFLASDKNKRIIGRPVFISGGLDW